MHSSLAHGLLTSSGTEEITNLVAADGGSNPAAVAVRIFKAGRT